MIAKIIETCLDIDAMAVRIYGQLAARAEDPELVAFLGLPGRRGAAPRHLLGAAAGAGA
jgi:hypothetical protein